MTEIYTSALLGILIATLTLVVQSFVAAITKAKQPGAIPGKINEALGQESFVFRAHRTFMNSLENFPAFLGAAFVAIHMGASAFWTTVFIWAFALSRLAHMILYYRIATDKNPSPRSYFYLIGFISTFALLILSALSVL